MVFETEQHRTEREARQAELYPELRVGEFSDIFEVDAYRRDYGLEPTSIGRQMEYTWASDEEALSAARPEP